MGEGVGDATIIKRSTFSDGHCPVKKWNRQIPQLCDTFWKVYASLRRFPGTCDGIVLSRKSQGQPEFIWLVRISHILLRGALVACGRASFLTETLRIVLFFALFLLTE
jgi:hypothetical protein